MAKNRPRTHTITKGDRRTGLGTLLAQGGKPVDLSGATVSAIVERDDGESAVAETTDGVTVQPKFAFTADAGEGWIVANDHLVRGGDQVVLSTSGSLPDGLTAGARYFARDVEENVFRLAETRDGCALNFTTPGTGEHLFHVVGTVLYAIPPAVADTAGVYWVWFVVTENGARDTFPNDGRAISIEVIDNGY